ncbi:MAG: hypothetical protein PHR28_09290 [candidate division Zixibacteria bacterium]|jgi:hypothetical protein|nr:hypothetical protein [candidate division Zixibacteria bacterium]
MSIEITTEPLLLHGEPYYLVTRINALSYDDLPTDYLSGIPNVWLAEDESGRRLVYCNTDHALAERALYRESDFFRLLDLIATAGHRLAAINDPCPKKQRNMHRPFALDRTRCRTFII